jgi:GTPase SAR1 family protein
MCGEEKARRETWSDQCIMASAIMFVIDVSSPASMHVARDELYEVLSHEELNPTAPLLVWANKMDVVGSITEAKLAEFLALDKRGDCQLRQWCVQGCVMHDHAKGLDHGLKWLYLALQQKPDKKKWKPKAPELIPNDVQAEVITPVRCVQTTCRQ